MPEKIGRDPAQFGLFATPLEALIAPDAEVRVIAAFVDQLNLAALGFKRIKTTGASAYGPAVLLKIYLYGYLNRVRSSRRLERECRLNVELMWLTGNLTPCFKTIAAFRSNHPAALKQVFREYVLLLKEWGAIGGKRIAVDGTRIHGQNARKKNFNPKKIKRHLDRIDARIAEHLAEAERVDEAEKSSDGSKSEGAGTQDALDVLQARRKQYEDLREQLEASDENQLSLTDPDARALVKHGMETLVGYNVQSTVDDDNKLIVNVEATNEVDIQALGKQVKDTHELLDLAPGTEVLADKGYHNSAELQRVNDLGHQTFVAERRKGSNNEEGNYAPDAFRYEADEDLYICPAGKELTTTGKLHQRKNSGPNFRVYRASRPTCGACPLRDKCLTEKSRATNQARSLTRLEHAAAIEANRKNLTDNPGVYQQRQAIVEHPFGTLKRHWGGYYTLLRGLKKVDGEYNLLACCYNIRRSVSIFGVLALLEHLEGRFSAIMRLFATLCLVEAPILPPLREAPWWLVVRRRKMVV